VSAQTDADDLATRVGDLLSASGRTIAVAESLTGGMLVQALAKAQGSGDWLLGGVVAYASSVKHGLLGVSAEHVVSPESAEQMAVGVRDRLRRRRRGGRHRCRRSRPAGGTTAGRGLDRRRRRRGVPRLAVPDERPHPPRSSSRPSPRRCGTCQGARPLTTDAAATFRAAYRHGFARVAACTITTAIGDPTRNAAAVLDVAAQCSDDGVAVACSPS
jgi:hypothetical protein